MRERHAPPTLTREVLRAGAEPSGAPFLCWGEVGWNQQPASWTVDRGVPKHGSATGVHAATRHRAALAGAPHSRSRSWCRSTTRPRTSRRASPVCAATWTRPEGGYFISLNATPGTAKQVVALAKDAGLALTAAGSTWPHGNDPHDSNLRLAPTFPSLEDVTIASEGIALCILLAAIEHRCARR